MLPLNTWTKSTRSGHNGACVEALDTGSPEIHIRDSKFGRLPGYSNQSPVMSVGRGEFSALANMIKSGSFGG